MDELWKDLRHAVRMWSKHPVLTIAIITSLVLGIGANTAIFCLIKAVFIQPLAVDEPDRLVAIYGTDEKAAAGSGMSYFPISYHNFLDLRDQNDVFSGMLAHTWLLVNVDDGEGYPERIFGQIVSANYFTTLGVKPFLGRVFQPEEAEPLGAHPVAVLSYRLWARRFGADPGVIGRSVRLNGYEFTIVGVAPENFKGPDAISSFEIWVPLSMYEQVFPEAAIVDNRLWRIFFLIGRLKPEVELTEASTAMNTIAQRLQEEYPNENAGRGVTLLRLPEAPVDPNQRQLYSRSGMLMMVVVSLVLLIACANIANLLLSRSVVRQREMAIRQSLGATRGRLARQVLSECTLLALIGGGLGLLFGIWSRNYLWSFRPPFFLENSLFLELDYRVLLFTLLVSLATGLLFGLAPALKASRMDLVAPLKDSPSAPIAGRPKLGLQSVFVTAQVALALVVLIGMGLFLTSLRNAQTIDPGFETRKLLVTTLDLGTLGYEVPQAQELYRRITERVQALPGVESASLASNRPLDPIAIMRTTLIEGQETEADEEGTLIRTNTVTPEFFETMGIPLLKGRVFLAEDRPETRSVAVVSRQMEELLWPDQGALGQRFRFRDQESWTEVVGVVEDIKYVTLGEPGQPHIYLPLSQSYSPMMNLHLRTAGPPAQVVNAVRQNVNEIERRLPLANVQTVSEIIRSSLWGPRLAAALMTVLGLVALALTAVGIYGVVAYSVTQRYREIGIRMVLGARWPEVVKMILRRGMVSIAVGVVLGLGIAAALGRLIVSFLYGISATEPGVLLTIVAILLLVALVAHLVPAVRAIRFDPARTMRAE